MEYAVRIDLVINEYIESIFIEIDKEYMNAKKNIVIGVIYRIPNTNMMDFDTTLASVLEQLCMENKLVYLMGDYNIDLFNSETHDLTNTFVDVMYCNEFLPLISHPTRITNRSATLIDNIFTNNHDNLNCSLSGILVADVSDHFPIFHINRSFTVEETESFLVTRVFNEKNKQKFREAISAVDWTEICNIPDTQNSFSHSFSADFFTGQVLS